MISYSNNEDDETISHILDKGIKDLERISKGYRIPSTSSSIIHKSSKHKSKCSIKRNITTTNNNTNCNFLSSSNPTAIPITNSYSSNTALTEGANRKPTHRNLLKKTKAVLHYNTNTPLYHKTKSNSSKRSISSSSKRSLAHMNKDSMYKTEIQLLEQETNVIWKDKYIQLKADYEKMNQKLHDEKQKNTTMTNALDQLKKKEADIPKLLAHQSKLEQVSLELQFQYTESELYRQKQMEAIDKLQAQLRKLRIELHSISPSQINSC